MKRLHRMLCGGSRFGLASIMILMSLVSSGLALAEVNVNREKTLDVDDYVLNGSSYGIDVILLLPKVTEYGFTKGISVIKIPVPPGTDSYMLNHVGGKPSGNFKAVYVTHGADVQQVLADNPVSDWEIGTPVKIPWTTPPAGAKTAEDGELWLLVSTPYNPYLKKMEVKFSAFYTKWLAADLDAWKAAVKAGTAQNNNQQPGAPSITIGNAGSTQDTTPTFAGTSANTSGNFTLNVNGSSYAVTGATNWTFTVPDALPVGSHGVTISGSGASASTTVTITAPAAPPADIAALQATLNSLIEKLHALCDVTGGVSNLCVVQP